MSDESTNPPAKPEQPAKPSWLRKIIDDIGMAGCAMHCQLPPDHWQTREDEPKPPTTKDR